MNTWNLRNMRKYYKIKRDLPVSWSLIKILWVTGQEQGSHVSYAYAPSHSDLKEWRTSVTLKDGQWPKVYISPLHVKGIKGYPWVGTWLSCSRPVTRRVLIKTSTYRQVSFNFIILFSHRSMSQGRHVRLESMWPQNRPNCREAIITPNTCNQRFKIQGTVASQYQEGNSQW